MGGYNGIFINASGVSRGMYMTSTNGLNYIVSGNNNTTGGNYLEQWQTDNDDGVGSGPATLTMPADFVPSVNNLWQFDVGYNATGGATNNLIAHPGQNLTHIDSTVNTSVYYGQFPGGTLSKVGTFTDTATLTAGNATITVSIPDARIYAGQTVTGTGVPANTTVVSSTVGASTTTVVLSNTATTTGTESITFDNNVNVSGGCVMIHPYLFVYGNNGLIRNSSAGDFSNWVAADSNANNVATGKIVKGLPLRGGTTSPSGLFWSLDALVRVYYNPTTVNGQSFYWGYDLLTSMTSIMSSSSVIEYDGQYFWAGVDRFLMYNGVVQEVPNQTNMNWFFDNVNYSQRQKIWVTKIPRWGEIWWFYPRGNATECNDAIIYNVREQKWYDAGLAEGAGRSAGVFSEVFRFPVWGDNTPTSSGKYTLWQHETGVDKIYLSTQTAIQSYIETNNIGWVEGGPGNRQMEGDNNWIRLERVEPDFVQSGTMNLYVTGKGYADDADVTTGPYYFDPTTLKIDMREQRREMRLIFESNQVGGNYQMGNILLSADIGDVRGTGNP
jgi:hypothetical protein